MKKMLLLGLAIALTAGTARAAYEIEADNEKYTVGDTQVAVAKAELKKCLEGTDRACNFYRDFEKKCGYKLPGEFNDRGVAVALLYGGSGSGNTVPWMETTYGVMMQMCTVMNGHDVYKEMFQKKVKKVLFDGTIPTNQQGQPTIKLDKNGTLIFGIAPHDKSSTGGLSEWGFGSSDSPLETYLKKL